MSNHLITESSPYLLQHATNPVNWYPWGQEAFDKARQENKPIFLSIGYSTCHWCHVMAHESFENKEIAEILNEYYVSIKVDREERPDIDSVYMEVCQALTGGGGWPMSIFMTADQRPFYAGTYFPPRARYGRMGFRELLLALAGKWQNHRSDLLEAADLIVAHMSQEEESSGSYIRRNLPALAVEAFSKSFDAKYGGFGPAPKFPMAHNLIFLTLYSKLTGQPEVFSMVSKTLEQMHRGGIFDQIGYGFSRYSTDPYYLVPHFEKMLYDNGLLILAYAAAYKASKETRFLDAAEETADYILREMTDESGAFYSAQDADSDGEEGKYYVWSYKEICEILGKDQGRKFCAYYGITEQGNFEGKNIPNRLEGQEVSRNFEQERLTLYEHRKARAKLHLDDKILTSWNSLTIAAMAVLYRVTGKSGYLQAAENAQSFLDKNLTEGTQIYVSCRNGKRSAKGFLDDYAYYTAGLIVLYEATGKEHYRKRAQTICLEAGRQFEDPEGGGYFLYGGENARLITRPKETYDGALPSGNSVMAFCLVRLSQLMDSEEFRQAASRQLAFLSSKAEPYPSGYSLFLTALLLYFYPPATITVAPAPKDCAETLLPKLPLYGDVTILPAPSRDYPLLNGQTTYYVCKDYTCLPPTNEEPSWP